MVEVINELVLNELKIADVLNNRYGDGTVYVPANDDHYDYSLAKTKGFISDEGYITSKGKTLVSKYVH